jgi:cytochrome c-type biogenesis protein CcmH/NrfF
MSFLSRGYPAMAISLTVAVSVLAASVWRRNWMLWLLGFALLVLAAAVAWAYRTPRAENVPTAQVMREARHA